MSDLISRQALCEYALNQKDKCVTPNDIMRFPSAQPQWIPCSERLPEEEEDVLVCSEDGDIDIACWMYEQWTDEPNIEWWCGEYRVDAVAWMPFPKPYGGESDV